MGIEASHPRKWYGDNLWTISSIQTFLGLAAPRSGEWWRESNVSKVSKIQEMGNGAILSLSGVFLDVFDGRVNHLMTRLRYCVRTRYGGGPILGVDWWTKHAASQSREEDFENRISLVVFMFMSATDCYRDSSCIVKAYLWYATAQMQMELLEQPEENGRESREESQNCFGRQMEDERQ